MSAPAPTATLYAQVLEIVLEIDYRPDYQFRVYSEHDEIYVQLEHGRPDARTGKWGRGKSGRYFVSPEATRSEIVRGCVGLALSYEEHEVREFFRYRGVAVFGPHISVDALAEVAENLDIRS